jgi:hypothetical protein
MLLITGCATNGYHKFYRPDANVSTSDDIELLADNAEPEIVQVPAREVKQTALSLVSKGYMRIGHSSFNGVMQNLDDAKTQAKRLRALLVLVWSDYTATQTSTTPLYMPTTSTTYGSGTVTAGSTFGTYSESSTTYGGTYVPVTRQYRLYDQGAMYFVKDTRKPRFGLGLINIPSETRKELGRNTGALVTVVFERTPAFYADIMVGDVVLAVGSKDVRDAEETLATMKATPLDAKVLKLKVLRTGVEREVDLLLQ